MSVTEVFLLAIALSMDAFAVAIAAGCAASGRGWQQYFRIGGAFGGFQCAMPIIGWFMGQHIHRFIAGWESWITFALLAWIGGSMLRQGIQNLRHGSEADVCPRIDPTTGRQLWVLAFATSIDALAIGLSFALTATPIVFPAVTIGIVCAAISALGVYLGRGLSRLRMINRFSELFGGIVLLALAIKALFA